MIPLRSRSDSLTFTPRLSAIGSETNFSRSPNEFRSFITNEKLTEELRKRFESYIGEPKGEPVIR